MSYFVSYKEVQGVKFFVRAFRQESGAKRSVTCARKRGEEMFYMTSDKWETRSIKTRTVKNLMSGREVKIAEGTPLCCDPSSETYWSM